MRELDRAREALGKLGLTISARNRHGEYRVAPAAGSPAEKETQAYYTEDLKDAVDTAFAMATKLNFQRFTFSWAEVEALRTLLAGLSGDLEVIASLKRKLGVGG